MDVEEEEEGIVGVDAQNCILPITVVHDMGLKPPRPPHMPRAGLPPHLHPARRYTFSISTNIAAHIQSVVAPQNPRHIQDLPLGNRDESMLVYLASMVTQGMPWLRFFVGRERAFQRLCAR